MAGKKSVKRIFSRIQKAADELLPRIESAKNYYAKNSLAGVLTDLERKASAPKVAKKARKISSKKRPRKITITIA